MAQQRDSAVQLKNEKILEVWAIVLNLKTHKSDMLCTSAEICSSDYKSAERTKKCLKLWRVSWHMCHSLLGSCNFFAWPQRIKCCLLSSFLNFLRYSVWVPKWVAAWSGSGFCWGCKEPFVCTSGLFFQHFLLNSRPNKLKVFAKLKDFWLNSSRFLNKLKIFHEFPYQKQGFLR